MNLYEVMMACSYHQNFHVYVTNIYDQNFEIAHGKRRDITDEDGDWPEAINHLMDKVDLLRVTSDGSILLLLVDKHYEEDVSVLYKSSPEYVAQWDTMKPETRPWRYYSEVIGECGGG